MKPRQKTRVAGLLKTLSLGMLILLILLGMVARFQEGARQWDKVYQPLIELRQRVLERLDAFRRHAQARATTLP